MFNHGLRGRRGGDNSGVTGLSTAFVEAKTPQVTINGYFIVGIDDLALGTPGGQTIVVTGGGFATGITGTIGGTSIGAVTYVSPTQVTFTSPAKSGGAYALVLTNSNGSTGALVPGLVYSSVPTFSTAANIGTVYETVAYTKPIVATSDSAVTYALTSGAFPPDATFNPSTGVLTGTVPAIASGSTTYQFAITATDAENQDVTLTFSLTESTDTVAWVSPANSATINLDGASVSQTLSATDAAGYSVSYSANALPTGLTLSSNTITGIPTLDGTVNTQLTATAATTNRTATNNITWVIALGDSFWNATSLLLNGGTSSPTYINDASLSNSQLTIAGDTKSTNFTPYGEGYFSYKFDGASYALGTTPNTNTFYGTTIGTRDFCLEGWGYWTSFNFGTYGAPLISLYGQTAGELMIRANKTSANTTSANFFSILGGSTYIPSSMFSSGVSVGTLYLNRWHHLAIQRVSGTWYFYIDGVMLNSTSAGDASLSLAWTSYYIGSDGAGGGGYIAGNVSNVRLNVGTVPYATAGFTVPTSPLTYLPTTKFLSAQSNRLIDNGPINATFTKGGTANTGVQITPFTPFTQPSSMRVPDLYSTYFDGTSGYISTSHNSQLSMDSGNFSAECWCYRTCSVSGETATLVNKSGTGFVSVPHWIFGSTNGYWSYGVGSSGTPGTTLFSTTTATLIVPDTWHHIAFIKTGTTYSLFLNGTRISTTTNATVPLDNNPLGLSIGFQLAQTSTSYWWGQISDVRINKGTLPTNYDATLTTIPVPTQKLTAVTGTVLLTCQDRTLKDNSANNFAMSSVAPAKPFPVSPFTQTYSSVAGLSTLGSAYFDGTGDYLSVPNSPSHSSYPGDFTVEGWFYTPSTSVATQTVFSHRNGASSYVPYIFWLTTTSITLYVSSNNSSWDIVNGANVGTIAASQWYHLAYTRTGTTCRVFLNGVQTYTFTTAASFTTVNPLQLGMTGPGETNSAMIGYLSDIRITKTGLYTSDFFPTYQPLPALANTSLLTLQYNGGASNNGIVDTSGWMNPLTRYGNATQGSFSPYSPTGWSTYIDGTSSVNLLTAGSSSLILGANNWTIEAWVYLLTATTGSTAFYIASNRLLNGAGSQNAPLIAILNQQLYSRDANGSMYNTQPTTMSINTWYHVAVCRSGSSIYSFINGVQEGTTFTYGSPPTFTGNQIAIGYETQFGFAAVPGYISNLRVVNGTARYTSNFTPSTTPLEVVTNTSLLTCQSNRFIDNSPNYLTFTQAGSPSAQAFSPFSGTSTTPKSYSAYYDGTGDQIQYTGSTTPFIFGTGDFTMECWVYMPEITSAKYMIQFGTITGGNFPLLYFRNNPYNFYFYYNTGYHGNTTSTISANTWYHVAVSRTSGTLQIFLNGVSEYSATDTTSFTCLSNYPLIGGSTNMNGHLSNVRIVNGTGLYTTNFTPSTTPLTAVANTQLLTCQSATIVDNSSNNFTLTVVGDTKPKPFNPFGQTITKGVAYNPSVHSGSLYLDGTGDYLTAPNSTSFDLSTGQWTIECWFYQLAAKQVQLFSVSAASWRLAISTDGSAGFTFNTNSTTSYPAGSFPPGQWNHISASFNADGTTAAQRSHANGKLIATGQYWPNADTTSLFYIGNNKDAAGAWDFNGYITDIRITKGQCYYYSHFYPNLTALPANSNTVFLVNGTNGGMVDQHNTHNLETVGNTQLASADPYGGSYYSNYFDGNADYLTYVVDGSCGTGNFTIECWVYFTAMTSASSQQFNTILGHNANWDTAGDIIIWANANTGLSYTLGYLSVTMRNFIFGTQSVVLSLGKWQHIAVVRESTTNMKIFVDGVLKASTTSMPAAQPVGSAVGWIVGAQSNFLDRGMAGYISNVRIVKGTALYSVDFTPSTTPLTAISGTNLLTCQSNQFKDNSPNNTTAGIGGSIAVKSTNPFQQNTGKSMYFDGTGDYVTIPYNNMHQMVTGNFTIEAWVFRSVVGAEHNIAVTRSGGGADGWNLRINAANTLQFYYTGGSSVTSTGTISAGIWVHVAVTMSASTAKLYINGVNDGTAAAFGTGTANSQSLRIGVANDNTTGYMNGYIADLRITKGVVRYTTTFTPPTKSLQAK